MDVMQDRTIEKNLNMLSFYQTLLYKTSCKIFSEESQMIACWVPQFSRKEDEAIPYSKQLDYIFFLQIALMMLP